MSLIVMLGNMDKLNHIFLKITIWHLWPQMTPGKFSDPEFL